MDKRVCPRCEWVNRPLARFCEQCARPLDALCMHCGFTLTPDARFCGGCGRAASEAPIARFGSPASYTPRDLAERILRSKAAVEGERKQVTVLFADVRGSLEVFAHLDPEDARKLMDPVLELMMEAVHHFEGTVNQVLGDGIMALFGAPLAHEDHAVRACYSALRMRDRCRRHAEGAARSRGVPLDVRIGLNSGEVVVRSIANDLHVDYSAVGATTHIAARLEQAARPGTILVSRNTLRLVEGYVRATAVEPLAVKGLTTRVEAYEVDDIGPVRSRLQSLALRGLTRFVGRVAEMEQLRRLVARVGGGAGQLVALVGEPGVGKSRLVRELMHAEDLPGWTVLAAGAVPYGTTIPYLTTVSLVSALFGIEDQDRADAIRERVRARLATSSPDATIETPLLSLLGVPVDDAEWAALPPLQRPQRT